MKGLVITTNNEMYEQDFAEPLYVTAGEAVGGDIEYVKPVGFGGNLCMLVNGEYLLQHMPVNEFGCAVYGTAQHGHPICGNIVIMKDGYRNGQSDIVGLSNAEIVFLFRRISQVTDGMVKRVQKREQAGKPQPDVGVPER